ncbi:hypothetical protein SAMN05216571_101273 [Onishia taeanensis]|uniref:Uncharacterized protein n=1 Tax=Onishia taeanensis TaxID=284577 RepID=A0A1G7N7K3_9GAMM|nr:hypothetical protein [Halomonas taeanensis]SDF70023.1 hypothetical protein SAMN05216571_101273 [Halomonas taeanensis]
MALSAPTNLAVQVLETLLPVAQTTERQVDAGPLVTLEQWTGGANPPQALFIVEQQTESHHVAGPLIPLDQGVYLYYPPATLVTFDQATIYRVNNVAQTLATISQTAEAHRSARSLVRARQTVQTASRAAQPRTLVYLDGADVTAQTARAMSITASEGDNRTASIALMLPPGPVNVTAYQGRGVEIVRLINGAPVPLFTGSVDRPVYDHQARRLRLECSDLRSERLNGEDAAQIQAMTGGLYSPITQREDVSGADYVAELMKTVAGTLDYGGDGGLRYRSWAAGPPRYTLTDADVHHQGVRLEFATRSEIINTITGTLEYRYYQRNDFSESITVQVEQNAYGLPASQVVDPETAVIGRTGRVSGTKVAQILPTKEALLSAANGVENWELLDFEFIELPANGWYRANAGSSPVAYSASQVVRETRAMGASAELVRYVSQPKRERYQLTISAPESVDQFGEVRGSSFRHAVETRVDPSVFEERGCAVIADPDDRRTDVDRAIQCLQRIAEREILKGHRQNYVELVYKADLLPVEIGDTIGVNTAPISAVGNVAELSHTLTREGDYYTTLKLAVSRVDSAVSVSENWALPAAPARWVLNPDSQVLPETPSCPLPTATLGTNAGQSRIEPDGTVVMTAPSIGRGKIDEIIGTRVHRYDIAIPTNPFNITVT